MSVRKSQHDLSASEKKAFIAAILELKKRPSRLHPGNPGFGRYDDFVEVHRNAMMPPMMSPPQPGWAHQSVVFLPWHRVLLYEFEKELQAVDPSVSVPYWDWTQDSQVASPLWSPDFLGGNGGANDGRVADGPFAGSASWPIRIKDHPNDPDYLRRQMAADPTAQNLPSTGYQSTVLAMTPYDTRPWEDPNRGTAPSAWNGFRPHLEVGLHNLVHRWVGGNMVDMTSPNDPVFWLHHCNCDRLWAVWQAQNPEQLPYLPSAGAAPGHNLNDTLVFHSAGAIAPFEGDFRPIDVLDHHALGVAYDPDPKGAGKFGPSAWKKALKAGAGFKPDAMRPGLPTFVLPPEIPALAGPAVLGKLLSPVALGRVSKATLSQFSEGDKKTISSGGVRTLVAGAGGPAVKSLQCPIDNTDVTASVERNCGISPAPSVFTQCANGHWAEYPCQRS